jgi:hypothetical protein
MLPGRDGLRRTVAVLGDPQDDVVRPTIGHNRAPGVRGQDRDDGLDVWWEARSTSSSTPPGPARIPRTTTSPTHRPPSKVGDDHCIVSCIIVSDFSPYWTTKGNLFQGNTYRVPQPYWEPLGPSSAVAWSSCQAASFDTSGTIISP